MKLTIICSWCGAKIGEKECERLDERLPRITHGICPKCRAKVIEELKHEESENHEDESQLTIERRL